MGKQKQSKNGEPKRRVMGDMPTLVYSAEIRTGACDDLG
jgi:hypothetical protein